MSSTWIFDFDSRTLRIYEANEGSTRLFEEFCRMNAPGSERAGPMSENEFFAYIAEEVERICMASQQQVILLRASQIHRRRLDGNLSSAVKETLESIERHGGRISA